ncbi:unnamed protein product [Cuscuta campestris]|uniref:Calmodulin n=1 Tax=Cuscuta campestris TaxID=132261 RepID=A0A484KME3_9ASTE|nr:unnamed protein product [Cuscuta campestris]
MRGTGRKKIEIKRIENEPQRMVTFSKRRRGLVSKAAELGEKTGAKVAVLVFSPRNNVYTYGDIAAMSRAVEEAAAKKKKSDDGGSGQDNVGAAAAAPSGCGGGGELEAEEIVGMLNYDEMFECCSKGDLRRHFGGRGVTDGSIVTMKKRLASGGGGGDQAAAEATTPRMSSFRSRARVEEELEQVFKKFDANGDGKISASELGSIMSSLGHAAAEEEVDAMIREVDADGDGFIDLREFIELNTKDVGADEVMENLRDAFSVFDADKNGSISAEELQNVLRSIGEECSLAECRKMISGVDRDGDGMIDFDEFKVMMLTGSHFDFANSNSG